MNILHCFRAPVGGLFRNVVDLANAQNSAGNQVGVVCDSGRYTDYSEAVLQDLDKASAYGVKRLGIPRSVGTDDVRAYQQLLEWLSEKKIDVIHGHGAKGGAYARLLGSRLNTKSVYTPHGGALHYNAWTMSGLMYLTAEKILGKMTDGIIFESQYSRNQYRQKVGHYGSKTEVIYNGLKQDEFNLVGSEHASFDFLFIGELRKLKGLDTLIEASRQVAGERRFSLLVVGQGADEAYLRRKVVRYGLDGHVTFRPFTFPARKIFSEARCVVIPSHKESLPYIVLELIGAGKPMIATNVGGIPEIFGKHRENLIPPDNVEELKEKMMQWLDCDQQIERIVDDIRGRAKQLFYERLMNQKVLRFYEELIRDEQTDVEAVEVNRIAVSGRTRAADRG